MNFCSGYSRFGTNTVKNLSQKTPWPSKIMGGTLRKPRCLTFGFLKGFDKGLGLGRVYGIDAFLSSPEQAFFTIGFGETN